MTIKEVINSLKYLEQRYGNISIDKLVYIKEVPFYIKRKEKDDGPKPKRYDR